MNLGLGGSDLDMVQSFIDDRVKNLTKDCSSQSNYEHDLEITLAALKKNKKKLHVDLARQRPGEALKAEFEGSTGKLYGLTKERSGFLKEPNQIRRSQAWQEKSLSRHAKGLSDRLSHLESLKLGLQVLASDFWCKADTTISNKYIKLKVRYMGTGKNKLYPVVDDEAKKNLVVFQAKEGFRTRDDAVEKILHMLPIWQEQEDLIRKLQADLEEAKKLNKELQDQVESS